ncbi:MAG: aminoacyl--tRNA ligase-related protein [bacterium]|nr:aminoacyl--tRNA ligase-related protein [bacterium]
MKQSQLFTKTLKNVPKDETSINAQYLIRAGYIDKLMAGVYSFLPLGRIVMKKIEDIVREEINEIDGQEILMPALHPKSNWQKTGRWDEMDDILYKLEDTSDRQFTLGPTHEEIVVPLVQQYISSYKDLPFAVYQFQTKFRKELRPKAGLLRGREFLMKDLYSFHTNETDLNDYYEKAMEAYSKIFSRVGLRDVTHLTYASGGAFSKYSHEYQAVSESGEDIIYVCQNCQLAINKEIKDETPSCPECKGNEFQEESAIEVGNIFKLQTKYSEPFGLHYDDDMSKSHDVIMGCYGIGLSRLMGTIVEIYHDEKGIAWPEEVAPFKFHLINLNNNSVQSDEVYDSLQKAGFAVLYDDRELSAGKKLQDADLIGLPYRLVVGSKSDGKVEYKPRSSDEVELLPLNEMIKKHA